jgi:UDP-glucose 4-epimerase
MKKILITGNSGYIGSHLTKILQKSNKDFELYGLDINEPIIVLENFEYQDIIQHNDWCCSDIEFDAVIHLAAEVAVGRSVLNPTLYYLTNTLGTYNVLKNIRTKNYIHASTGSAAGLASPYGISKRGAEDIVHQHCKENQIPYTIFRFYNVTGSDGINPTNPDGLFYNLMQARFTGEFNLFGNDYNTPDGTCLRDYTHVNEICFALEKAIDDPANGLENLGHGVGTSVMKMVEIFKQVNDCDFKVNIKPRRAGDLEVSVLDNPSRYMPKIYTIEDLLKVEDGQA